MAQNNMTAVEWFHDKLDDLISDGLRERIELLKNEAKKIEKEQIMKAASTVLWSNSSNSTEVAEQYYNERYGKE